MNNLRLIAFEVTRRCRFNCRHCRANAGAGDDKKELTGEQCKKILESVACFGRPVIIFTGGEPAERSDIYELIRHSRRLGLRPVMATCGYTINDESAAELKNAGITALSFSLDGASAKTHNQFRQTQGAFDLAIRAAESARRAGIRFQINTTITKSNISEVHEIAELSERLGAYCFNPFILVPTGRGEKLVDRILAPAEYEELLHNLLQIKLRSKIELRVTCGPQFARVCYQAQQALAQNSQKQKIINEHSGCMGGRGFGFISYRGDVKACGFLDISAGNLVENGFDFSSIWLESELLKKIRNRSAYKGNCAVCKYLEVCGGCRARAYTMTGDYLDSDPVCGYQPG